MIFTRKDAVGIDTPIERILCYLEENYLTSKFNAYGRIYKRDHRGKTVPFYYSGEGNYKEVLFDSKLDGSLFFNVGDFEDLDPVTGQMSSDIEIIVSVNLERFYTDNVKNDEQIRIDFLHHLDPFKGVLNIDKVVKGLDNVYSDFDRAKEYFHNLYPYYHFKLTGKIYYNINNNTKL